MLRAPAAVLRLGWQYRKASKEKGDAEGYSAGRVLAVKSRLHWLGRKGRNRRRGLEGKYVGY